MVGGVFQSLWYLIICLIMSLIMGNQTGNTIYLELDGWKALAQRGLEKRIANHARGVCLTELFQS